MMKRRVLLAVAAALGAAHGGAAPAATDRRVCTDNGRACLERTAMLYLDALLSTDDARVPLAPDVRRVVIIGGGRPGDNVRKISGEAGIRERIRLEKLGARSNLRLVTDERRGEVVAIWTSTSLLTGVSPITVVDRFRIRNGTIREIEAISADASDR